VGDNLTVSGNATISGDLTVNGSSTIIDSTTVAVGDSMFKYAKDNSADSIDIGFYGKYVSSGTKYSGIFRDASDSGKFKVFATTGNSNAEPGTTVNTTSGFTLGTLEAHGFIGALTGNASTATKIASITNSDIVQKSSTQTLTNKSLTSPTITGTGAIAGTFTGNITGNVTGNVTGNLTGDVTGKADTADALETARTIGGVSFDGSGNIDLPGVNTAGNQNTSGTAAKATKLNTSTNGIVKTSGSDGTLSIGSLSSSDIPNNAADTTGNAASATALATGRTIAMTGDVAWTSGSFNGSGNVTGTSTIQSGAVEGSMLSDLLKGFSGSLTDGTTGIARTTPTGKTVYTCTVATMYATGADGRKCMVEVLDGTTYATVHPCVTRDGNDVVITFNGTVNNGDYRILIKQVV